MPRDFLGTQGMESPPMGFVFFSMFFLTAVEEIWNLGSIPMNQCEKNISGNTLFILCHPVARSPLDGCHLGVTTRLYQFGLSWDENP